MITPTKDAQPSQTTPCCPQLQQSQTRSTRDLQSCNPGSTKRDNIIQNTKFSKSNFKNPPKISCLRLVLTATCLLAGLCDAAQDDFKQGDRVGVKRTTVGCNLACKNVDNVIYSGMKGTVTKDSPGPLTEVKFDGINERLMVKTRHLYRDQSECPDCNGRRMIGNDVCGRCRGVGTVIADAPAPAEADFKPMFKQDERVVVRNNENYTTQMTGFTDGTILTGNRHVDIDHGMKGRVTVDAITPFLVTVLFDGHQEPLMVNADYIHRDTAAPAEVSPAAENDWSCPACTYLNPLGTTACDVCRAPKPALQDRAAPEPVHEENEAKTQEPGVSALTNDELCAICMEKKITHIIVPCGHKCICDCVTADQLNYKCPICRGRIQLIMKVFRRRRLGAKLDESEYSPDHRSDTITV